MHRLALAGLGWLLACHTAGVPTAPGPQEVAQEALSAARAGKWAEAVAALDPSILEGYRSAMLNASDLLVAAHPKIFAQADSITPEAAGFYARLNAINAAGGPLLPLMGARNLDELKALSPAEFATRLLSHFDSASTRRDSTHATRTYSINGRPTIHDSVATIPLSIPGGPARTVHLVRRNNAWWLSDDGLLAFLTLAAR